MYFKCNDGLQHFATRATVGRQQNSVVDLRVAQRTLNWNVRDRQVLALEYFTKAAWDALAHFCKAMVPIFFEFCRSATLGMVADNDDERKLSPLGVPAFKIFLDIYLFTVSPLCVVPRKTRRYATS